MVNDAAATKAAESATARPVRLAISLNRIWVLQFWLTLYGRWSPVVPEQGRGQQMRRKGWSLLRRQIATQPWIAEPAYTVSRARRSAVLSKPMRGRDTLPRAAS